jgi:hypothetical protein
MSQVPHGSSNPNAPVPFIDIYSLASINAFINGILQLYFELRGPAYGKQRQYTSTFHYRPRLLRFNGRHPRSGGCASWPGGCSTSARCSTSPHRSVASAAPATNHDVEIRVSVKKETELSSWALFLIALFLIVLFLIAVALISIAVIYLSPEECELVLRLLGIQCWVER